MFEVKIIIYNPEDEQLTSILTYFHVKTKGEEICKIIDSLIEYDKKGRITKDCIFEVNGETFNLI